MARALASAEILALAVPVLAPMMIVALPSCVIVSSELSAMARSTLLVVSLNVPGLMSLNWRGWPSGP